MRCLPPSGRAESPDRTAGVREGARAKCCWRAEPSEPSQSHPRACCRTAYRCREGYRRAPLPGLREYPRHGIALVRQRPVHTLSGSRPRDRLFPNHARSNLRASDQDGSGRTSRAGIAPSPQSPLLSLCRRRSNARRGPDQRGLERPRALAVRFRRLPSRPPGCADAVPHLSS